MSDLHHDRILKTSGRTFVLMTIGWWLVAVGWGLIGLIVAGLGWRDAPEHTRDTYRYMVRTVLIGPLYAAPGAVAFWLDGPLVLVSVLAIPVALWHAARCLQGLVALARDRPLADPLTWLV